TVPGRASSVLVTWGPYRFTRNPMYVGLTLAYLGEVGILQQTWPVVLLPLTVAYVNWIVIPVEEAKLKEVFGDEYERDQARERRWVWAGGWRRPPSRRTSGLDREAMPAPSQGGPDLQPPLDKEVVPRVQREGVGARRREDDALQVERALDGGGRPG